MVDPYTQWAAGVLGGISAPMSSANEDTLWAWSGKESGSDRMRWNNPLNTTQELPRAVDPDMNAVGVEAYSSVQDGITATVQTLLNGRYPTIVAHLRNSVPRALWGDACAELDTWGTGCGAWLTTNFGAAAGSAVGEDMATGMLIKDSRGATWFTAGLFGPKRPVADSGEEDAYAAALTSLGFDATVRTDIPQFVVDLMDDDPGSASPRFEDATKAALDAIKAELAAGTDAGTAAAVARIEAALKAA